MNKPIIYHLYMNYSITQYGKPLDKSKYTIDENTKTFYSMEDNLVLDFKGLCGWTFNTVSDCTFRTGDECVVIRMDIYDIIELKKDITIKLNEYGIGGYEKVEEKKKIILDGKELEISDESYEEFKKRFN